MDHSFGFSLQRAGRAALRALAVGSTGKVLAVFRRSFYLQSTERSLVCLGPPSMGSGPLNAECVLPSGIDWEASGLRPGTDARREEDTLFVGERFVFSLVDVEEWKPRVPVPGWGPETLTRGLFRLAELTESIVPSEGLGRFIPVLARRSSGTEFPSAGKGLAHAASAAAALDRWLSARAKVWGHAERNAGANWEMSTPLACAEGLIGLGPGLTPAGDDYLGGFLIALRVLGWTSAAERLAGWALPLARSRTGKISFAHLACAAEGEGSDALHGAISAILASDEGALLDCLGAIDAIGQTSGWDALAGATAACAQVAFGTLGMDGRISRKSYG